MPAARTWIAAAANETRAAELKRLRTADVMLVPPVFANVPSYDARTALAHFFAEVGHLHRCHHPPGFVPGIDGRSSNHRPWILDCQSKSDASDFDHLVSAEVGQARLRVKPGNDTGSGK